MENQLNSLDTFFNPKSIAVIGVSTEPSKLGAIIFNSIINYGYKGELYAINPRAAGKDLYGKKCLKSVTEIPEPLDLVVVVVPAKVCLGAVKDCVQNKTKNISIIAAGFAETGNVELENSIKKICLENHINLLGPNSLGHISIYNTLNASFVDGIPKKGPICFISQSGAYCSSMLDWATKKNIGFSHFISIGNKTILNEYILLKYLVNDNNTQIFCFYLESLSNGAQFFELVKQISYKKPCVFLIPGKSKKAQEASASHTGSLAPNYTILENQITMSGALHAHDTREFFGFLEMLYYSNSLHFGGKIAILTNGGGVGVLASDLCEENELLQEPPNQEIIDELKKVCPPAASFKNPIDILGDAKGELYGKALEILVKSGYYQQILVLLTPQKATEPKKTAEFIVDINKKYKNTKVNIYTSYIGGTTLEESVNYLRENNVLNYDYPTDCLKLIGILKKQEKYRQVESQKLELPKSIVTNELKELIQTSINNKDLSLPQKVVDMILNLYKIPCPLSGSFTKKEDALKFISPNLKNKEFVLKLSSPDALHKTEMKGIYLNISNEAKFNESWDNLQSSIKNHNLKNASILIQEMIKDSVECFIGINSDKNFGKVLVFGTGGIYTEIYKDTSLRILPCSDLDNMINETKIGKILGGIRGQKPKYTKGLIDIMMKIQNLVNDIPEIKSIDMNPILVNENSAVVVDFKILV